MDVEPGEPKRRPSQGLSAVLLITIALKRPRIRVIRPTIQLNQESAIDIREVGATHEPTIAVEHVELSSREFNTAFEQNPKESVFEKALGPAADTPMQFEKWSNDAHAAAAPLCHPPNELLNITDLEELLSQARAQRAFDKPGTRCSQVDHRSRWLRERNTVKQRLVGQRQVQGLVNDD
jgi:hypothetical protein